MRTLVIGVSEGGKDFLLEQFKNSADSLSIFCGSYSALLLNEINSAIQNEVNSNDLRNMDHRIISQAKKSLNDLLGKKKNWILSSHIAYRLEDNYIFSVETIRKLKPDVIIHVSSPASEILARRDNLPFQVWPIESEEEINFHQNISETISEQIAKIIGCKYLKLENLHRNVNYNQTILSNFARLS